MCGLGFRSCVVSLVLVTLVAIILGYFVIPDVGSGRNARLFSRYPVESRFTLSNGEKIKMPWHIYEAQHAMIVGEAKNKQMAYNFLSDLGLYPMLSSNSLPLTTVGIVSYKDGAAGAYNEIYVSFLATKSPPLENTWLQYLAFIIEINPLLAPLRGLSGLDGVTLVVWKMYVTTERSLLGGREIWGYPKEMADIGITYSARDPKEITGSTTFLNGKPFVQLRQSGHWPWYAQKLPFYLDGSSATPRDIFHSVGDSKGQVLCRFKPFDRETDEFEFYAETPAGKEIVSLDITPWLWFDLSFFEVVLFPPRYTE